MDKQLGKRWMRGEKNEETDLQEVGRHGEDEETIDKERNYHAAK